MTTARRILTLVCILTIVVGAVTSTSADLLAIVLVPLDPLFGIIVAVPVVAADAVPLRTAPVLSVRSPRAPPL